MAKLVPGRIYKDFTTESYRQGMLVAWMIKRSALPYVARLGPEVARTIADFLLTLTPPAPNILASAMERRRRLERLDDLLNNPVLRQMTRASMTLSCASNYLSKRDAIGMFPKPPGWHMRDEDA